MSTRMRTTVVPDDVELYCLALAHPGVFYFRAADGSIVSGATPALSKSWQPNSDCGGPDDDYSNASWAGYIALAAPSIISFSLSGVGAPPLLAELRGEPTSAGYNADGQTGSQFCTGEPTDCCEQLSDFGTEFSTSVISKGPCCPIPVSVVIQAGSACTSEGSHGYPGASVTVELSLIPES